MSKAHRFNSRARWIAAALALLVAQLSPTLAQATTISGQAEVLTPYSFKLQDYEVFLLGVDSVEVKQTCTVSGKIWECWAAAQRQLETMLSEGEVTCESMLEQHSPKRMIALCTVNGEDVGQRLVASGFGLALPKETSRYNDAQTDARVAGIGLWQGTFTNPSAWRSLAIRAQSNRPQFTGKPID